MASDWWKRLPAEERREYERSNAIATVPLAPHEGFAKVITTLADALTRDDGTEVQRVANVLVRAICRRLKMARAVVCVASGRPHNAQGELHGLYEPREEGGVAHITVWMRTAKRGEVVAARTFLRTLLYEVGHHLDMELFDLPQSYHSQGFYRREASLYRIITMETIFAVQKGGRRTPKNQKKSTDKKDPKPAPSTSEGLAMLRAVAAEIRDRRRDRSGPGGL